MSYRELAETERPYNEMWVESQLLTLHFHASPFILNLACGAENKVVSVSQFLKREHNCYLVCEGKGDNLLFPFFLTLGGVLHRSQIAD